MSAEHAEAADAIVLEDVWLKYPNATERHLSVRNLMRRNHAMRESLVPQEDPDSQWVLKGLNLRLARGSTTGIIGRNGAGKSTLLQVLAGILPPQRGEVQVHGTCVPLLNLGGGIVEALSGWENLHRLAVLRQVPPMERKDAVRSAAMFSELGAYLKNPVRTYSTGMRLRLTFSIATVTRPQVLLLDEFIGTGDIDFQSKSRHRIAEFTSGQTTVVLTTHSMDFLRANCPQLVWLDNGQVRAQGGAEEVIEKYREANTK